MCIGVGVLVVDGRWMLLPAHPQQYCDPPVTCFLFLAFFKCVLALLYEVMSIGWSVGWSVGRLVGWSDGLLVTHLTIHTAYMLAL